MKRVTVDGSMFGERLDKALALIYPEYSRSAIEKLITLGQIRINNEQVKTKYLLREGDAISVDFSELEKEPEAIDLPILYEDDDVLVINKPVGVLAHSKGTFNKEGTVATWLKTYHGVIPDSDEESSQKNETDFWNSNRAGIVHRLDRDTSGVMAVAKNEAAQRFLQKQFAKRNVKKVYQAVVSGTLPADSSLIDVPIERNPKKPATFRAGANGKPAQTEFRVLSSRNNYSLVELKPLTGRTHQLRVHLQYLGCPIVGDRIYGTEPAERMMLHAYTLELTLPSSQRKVFTAELPPLLHEILA